MTETLTDEERAHLRLYDRRGEKALRIIDAHAADRAAIVAQLEEARGLRASLEELAKDRSDERYGPGGGGVYVPQLRALLDRHPVVQDQALSAAESEVTRLTEALAAAEKRTRTELARVDAAEARVEALETLLDASEARAAQWQADAESYRADATVAQDRLAALLARVDQAVAALETPPMSNAEVLIARILRG